MPEDVWSDVVGQPDVVAELRAAATAAAAQRAGEPVPANIMTHSWLFTGPPGSGRSVAARAFAAALLCRNGGCGRCSDCRTVRAGTHTDVRHVDTDGLSIPVREMRDVVQAASRRPSVGAWRVVIVEDADRLTDGASNALLKAVEEPPERTVFLLCAPSTHPADVSATIRSRCRLVPLRVPSADAVAELLVRRDGVPAEEARWAALAAGGHVGRARRLAQEPDARARREAVLAIPAALRDLSACFRAASDLVSAAEEEAKSRSAELDGPETEALKVALGGGGTGKGIGRAPRGSAGALADLERRQKARVTRNTRDALDRALVDLAGYYRDVLAARFGADIAPAHPDRADESRELARGLSPESVLVMLDAVLGARAALAANVKPQIAVEAMTVNLRLPA